MDNGDGFLDNIDDTADLFGGQNDATGMFDWDEILGDNETDTPGSMASKSGNLETNVHSNLLLTSQNYAVTSSIPAPNISIAASHFPQTLSSSTPDLGKAVMSPTVVGQSVVNPVPNLASQTGLTNQILQQGNQQFILKTASGGQIQLSSQAQLQQLLQQQQQSITANSTPHFQQVIHSASPVPSSSPMHNRSITPNSGGLAVPFVTHSSGNIAQLKSTSPAPNVNIVHLPSSISQPQQQQQQSIQQPQVQLAPGTFLLQGQPTVIGNPQQGAVVNAQNTVIQNPNVVNVNVAAQHVLCNNPTQQVQQRNNFGLANIQTATQNPFNIQGTLIQTAEGKSILIPSQQLAQPINIQQLSVATPVAQTQVQQPTTATNMIQLAQPQSNVTVDNRSSQGLQQIVLNSQGQQILLQRASVANSQPQNIILRAGNQSGIVQLQPRTGQPAQLQNAQQTLQALASSGGQQVKIINQSGVNQPSVPMINIGGQNLTLQQLSSQLGNVQAVQLLQQQQQQQQSTGVQQQVPLQQTQISAGQNQLIKSSSVTFQQQGQALGQSNKQQIGQTNSSNPVLMRQTTSAPPTQVKLGHDQSVDNQTQLILQQIKNSMKKSQSESVCSVVPSYSSSSPAPNVNIMNVKQENLKTNFANCSVTSSSIPQFSQTSAKVKSEPNLIETLIKQEQDQIRDNSCSFGSMPVSSKSSVTFQGLLTNTGQTTGVTTTVSQATTSMSMFVVSNSGQNTVGGNVLTSSSAICTESIASSQQNFLQGQSHGSNVLNNVNNISSSVSLSSSSPSSLSSSSQQPMNKSGGGATLQTIHLPPNLQQQLQRVQQEIKKVQTATNMPTPQKQQKLQQLQIFQRRILLKGRVLATTKAEPHQIQQGIAALAQIRKPLDSSTGVTSSDSQQNIASAQMNTNSSQISLDNNSQIGGNLPAHLMQGQSGVQGQLTGQGQSSWQGQIQSTANIQQVHPDSTSSLGQIKGVAASAQKPSSQTLSNLLVSSNSQPSSISHNPQVMSSLHPTQSGMLSSNQQGQQQVMQTPMSSPQLSQTTPTSDAPPQVAVPTQIKIANKVLTLSLTQAQKEKVQSYLDRMTPEQQQQYLQTQQGVLQRIQRQQQMQAQIRAQVEAQKKQAAAGDSSPTIPVPTTALPTQLSPQKMLSSDLSNGQVKPEVKVIPVPSRLSGSADGNAGRGIKRSFLDIPKGTLINQQIRQDQNHALNPDVKRPFRSRSDACRRLLRYHVFQKYGPTTDECEKFDEHTEQMAKELLRKKDWMFEKFRLLLLQESLRVEPSSELVMLQRMQNQELRKLIEEEKHLVQTDPELFVPMPLSVLKPGSSASDQSSDSSASVKQEQDIEEMSVAVKVEVKEEEVTVKTEYTEKYERMEEESFGVKQEREFDEKCERVKKLVIRSDGQNYSSSFKRRSVDSLRSSMDSRLDLNMCQGDLQDTVNEETIDTVTSADSDDTNEYTNDSYGMINDEAEQAALSISEESHDSQTDDEEDLSNQMRVQSSKVSDESVHYSRTQRQISRDSDSRNYELTGDSMYFGTEESNDMMPSSVEKLHQFSSMTEVSAGDSHTAYLPSHSPVSNDSNDVISANMQKGGGSADYLDKFSMYQPITENLSDSEENSYFPTDSMTALTGGQGGDVEVGKSLWETASSAQVVDDNSDQESDQEVKAQMESAINSILSLSQDVTVDPRDTGYSFSQSNQFYGNNSQPESSYSNSSALPLLSEKGVQQGCDSPLVNDDLDTAVNSILM